MQAVEFEANASNGVIIIPEKFRKFADGKFRIIMLKQDERKDCSKNNKISDTKRLLGKIREKRIFRNIKNPEDWQRSIRNEW